MGLDNCCTSKDEIAIFYVSRDIFAIFQVFYIGKEDGNIDVWDLMDRSHEPSMSQNISSSAITSLVPYRVSSKQVKLYYSLISCEISKNFV